MSFTLTWLKDVLLQAGLKVAPVDGWERRGIAEMGEVQGILCHHTAGSKNGNMPSLGIITNGRADLHGPLAHLGLGRDGTFYIVAAGRCNHAGPGNWNGITSGNTHLIGIEAENTGLSNDNPWPAVQLDAYYRGVAAILKHIGKDASFCAGHKEYALPRGRKSDPDFDMIAFRSKVSAILTGAARPSPLIPAVNANGIRTIRRGDTGPLVKQLQAKLSLTQDGVFGPGTEAAAREFQRQHGLVPDGIIGPKSWAILGA